MHGQSVNNPSVGLSPTACCNELEKILAQLQATQKIKRVDPDKRHYTHLVVGLCAQQSETYHSSHDA